MTVAKEQVKQWLDAQIGVNIVQHQKLSIITDRRDAEGELIPDIVLADIGANDFIQLTAISLRTTAKIMGLPIEVVDRGEDYDEWVRYELSFVYNGMKFLALESEAAHNEYTKG